MQLKIFEKKVIGLSSKFATLVAKGLRICIFVLNATRSISAAPNEASINHLRIIYKKLKEFKSCKRVRFVNTTEDASLKNLAQAE